MSINRGIDKEDIIQIYNGILLSHKRNKIVPFAETQMDLETVKQTEVSQKEKNKYHNYHVYAEFRRMIQIGLFEEQKQRHRHREQTRKFQVG